MEIVHNGRFAMYVSQNEEESDNNPLEATVMELCNTSAHASECVCVCVRLGLFASRGSLSGLNVLARARA